MTEAGLAEAILLCFTSRLTIHIKAANYPNNILGYL